MNISQIKQITHDNRKLYPQVYAVKPGSVHIQQIPNLQYVSQEMNTSFHMDWTGHPQPLDEQWVVWKIVNQVKRISKGSLDYKFKLMPPEIIWQDSNENNRYSVSHMMQVPDCITVEIFEEAKACVQRNLRNKIPQIKFISANSALCAQKLHVGHYRDTHLTLQEINNFAKEQGYKVKGNRREIYLTPAMADIYPPESWKTIVRVEIEKLN
ncbi:GyrI-like domain-containing protein [Paenibacillus sp. GP183]|uniref:GyrI-like domain-containing protein n=1 Tax=Paenibacillus sp. GP183 TaxID=1882751 RepID=UPI00089973D7|nr:GyrI-like domain-containing protein [Paenibacillus sp. GP183]SEC18268.1 GyrI-like small molecule binding domain-containing protein [Paenibacillus sp. GP183]